MGVCERGGGGERLESPAVKSFPVGHRYLGGDAPALRVDHPGAHGLPLPLGTATLRESALTAVCDWGINYCPGAAALYALLLKGE